MPVGICISSLEKHLFKSFAHFLIFFFFFLLLSCMSSGYILDINILSNRWFACNFSYSVDCLFVLLIVSFAVQKLFSCCSPTCLFLLLLLELWLSHPKNHCQDQYQEDFSLFPLVVLLFLFFYLLFNTLRVIFCEWCEIGVQFHSFVHEYPIFPASLVEETVLSSLNIFGFFVKY